MTNEKLFTAAFHLGPLLEKYPADTALRALAARAGHGMKELFRKEDKLSADDPKDKVQKGSPHKVFVVKLQAGTTYLIDMQSLQFDTYLRLEDPAGKELAKDDDGGDGLNARIVFTPERDGDYRLVATSFAAATGEFTLTVRGPGAGKK